MLSRPQQILLKRAQREAGLDDADYREALQTVSGCRSSTDTRLTDRQVDLALAYFEAIYWRAVDSGALQPTCKPNAIFRQRGFWASRNPRENTSRDRFNRSSVGAKVAELESTLAGLGFGASYCASIREKVAAGQASAYGLHLYKAALQRTLRAKQRKAASEISPQPISSG